MDYKKLQNGSDIRGVALEGIEGQHVNLTEQVCKDIGRGFALWLMNKTGKKLLRVAVGRDSRLSGPQLSQWICQAMVEQGIAVTDFGMASTPAMFMSTVLDGYAFDGSVMITASHNPKEYNGYKVYGEDGAQMSPEDTAKVVSYIDGIKDYLSVEADCDRLSRSLQSSHSLRRRWKNVAQTSSLYTRPCTAAVISLLWRF